jgi:hypothetical protein
LHSAGGWNIFADEIVLCYALHPTERFAEAAGYLFLSIVLFFLKRERIWRLIVIVLWLLQIAPLGYAMMTMD